MTLADGARLGPYEILGPLGSGGMGEVYRARDTKLKRDVALKVLPDSFTNDPDRLARFQREAEVLASLNHPHIAHIHGLEESDGVRALVLEFVDGPTLADRIAEGPIPVDEALPIARQIAEALEAAHEQGIIHRDLKPANIKLRPDGTVKVLDFGLAKALDQVSGIRGQVSGDYTGSPANSPTITSPAMTQMGVILGTAAYMSPEQAKGKPADKRSDIWAFGCVLYEMLTGARAFEGEDIVETIGAVVHKAPAWEKLPASTPPVLRMVLQRCLEKRPQSRMRDIGDVQLAVSGAFESSLGATDTQSHARRGHGRWWAIGASASIAAALLGAAGAWLFLRPALPVLQSVRFTITPAADQPLALQGFFRQLAISPDGTRIAYAAGIPSELVIRAIDRLEVTPLRGTSGANFPFFSPDGRWIGFFTGANGEIRKVPIAGGPPVTVCRYRGTPRGASWGPDDGIVFATNDVMTGLQAVPAGGGEPRTLTTPDHARGEQDHWMPSLSPDGEKVFFTIATASAVDDAQIAVLDLKTGQRTTVLRGGNDAVYVDAATGTGEVGHLVYASDGTLRAVRFDLARLAVVGDPVSVVEQVMMMQTGATEYSVSRQGTLIYVTGPSLTSVARSLVWVSRDGREEALDLPRRQYTFARLSPDETRVALAISDQENDVWVHDLARRTTARLPSDPSMDGTPIWAPDGERIVFTSMRSGPPNIYSQRADGTGVAERLTTSSEEQFLGSFSPDGRVVVFHQGTGPFDLMLLRLHPAARVEPLLATPIIEAAGEISPDGRWIAYFSNESGTPQVFVRPFPNVGDGRVLISSAGGTRPAWSKNGRELFYMDPSTAIMAVPVRTAPSFSAGSPTKLFDGPWYNVAPVRPYDVSRDNQRFLMIKNTAIIDSRAAAQITVVVNWNEELKRLVPAK